jgi:hypothetical protein
MLTGGATSVPGLTILETGAESRQDRLPWGATTITDPSVERLSLAPVPSSTIPGTAIADPVDIVLRTFRAYYPLNYPGSVVNQNFTFGTSILPDVKRFATANPFGRGHSSGCSGCHASYNYDGSRNPTPVVQNDGSVQQVVDPTTQHREFHEAADDIGVITGSNGSNNGAPQLIGRVVNSVQQQETGLPQQKTYGADHVMTTAVTTDQCGLCHGFVTRINYAYQGMAEEEQRDQLSRRAPVQFTTPGGTQVQILDSWVRQELDPTTGTFLIEQGVGSGSSGQIGPGLTIVQMAIQRDQMLAGLGIVAGNGGCAPNVYTEDCNNDGELETSLTLTTVDANGISHTKTINEDLNGNGKLDLIDRLPREQSIDGRQMRYVYGGRNGSTRLMDVHFERGMQCIDCHFLQDVHGDGHVYSTNWDQIEIECEDCHGALSRATLKTSGPNGGNDLTRAVDANQVPYFSVQNGKVTQRSRVTPGMQWTVPQTVDLATGLAKEAHSSTHIAAPGKGSTFAGKPGSSALTDAKLECATCHSSWIHNCLGCHIDLNQGDPQRLTTDASGNLTHSANENEIWLSNASDTAHVNFQLLGLLRAPFVLGVSGSSEVGRLATFRSSMQAHVTVTDQNRNTAFDNLTFTTFQAVDGNSGRAQVATSAVAMNQTMPHTVRPVGEERGCETCHRLVNAQNQVRNEHELAETYGIGTGAIPFIGDWVFAAGTGGLELYEYKQEKELPANVINPAGSPPPGVTRFPGMIASDCDRTAAKVEPTFDGSLGVAAASVANDVVLVRNFNPTPAPGQVASPTLTDLAIIAVNAGGAGKIVVSDVTHRGNPTLAPARPSVGDPTHELVLSLPAVPLALAHVSPDVSDPFVYAALGTSGVAVIQLLGAPSAATPAAQLVGTFPLASGNAANEIALAGDMLYVGTTAGTVEAMSLANPISPTSVGTPVTINSGTPIKSIAIEGFVLYAASSAGIAALALDDPQNPAPLSGASGVIVDGNDTTVNRMIAAAGHLYLAEGTNGVIDLDVRTPATPVSIGNLAATLAPGQAINAVDVVLSVLPGQNWLLVLDAIGDLWTLKLDNRLSTRERCYPNPQSQGCLLDLAFLDATQSGRDPSFDPVNNVFDDGNCADRATNPFVDPSAKTFFHFTRTIVSSGSRLARGAVWEQVGTLTGRRVRDSFMPGSSVLSLSIMQMMRSVSLCESTGPSNHPGNLGALGYADANFLASGNCVAIGETTASSRLTPTRAAPRVRTGADVSHAGADGATVTCVVLALAVLALVAFAIARMHGGERRRSSAPRQVARDLSDRVRAAAQRLDDSAPWQPARAADAPEAAAAIETALIAGDAARALAVAESAIAAAPEDRAHRVWLAWALCASAQPRAALAELGAADGPLANYVRARAEHLAFEHASGASGALPALVTAGDLAIVTLARGRGAGAWLPSVAGGELSPEQVGAAVGEHREITARCLACALDALDAEPGFVDAAYLAARLAIKAGAIAEGRAMFAALVSRMAGRPDADAFARDRADLDDPAGAVAAATKQPVEPSAKRSRRLRVLA